MCHVQGLQGTLGDDSDELMKKPTQSHEVDPVKKTTQPREIHPAKKPTLPVPSPIVNAKKQPSAEKTRFREPRNWVSILSGRPSRSSLVGSSLFQSGDRENVEIIPPAFNPE